MEQGRLYNAKIKYISLCFVSVLLDPLRDELPPGVVGEVVCREHLALDEGLQVLNLEVADLGKRMLHLLWRLEIHICITHVLKD